MELIKQNNLMLDIIQIHSDNNNLSPIIEKVMETV